MNSDAPERRHRRSIRLTGYDYTQAGAYFVTVCSQRRACLYGEILDGQIHMNAAGRLVQAVWNELPTHYPHIELDVWVVMPNHLHGIVVLWDREPMVAETVGAGFKPALPEPAQPDPTATVGAGFKPAQPAPTRRHGLAEIMRGFKTFSARRINELRAMPAQPVWQRGYYEHIIRNDASLQRVREYIANNPGRWAEDTENPALPRSARR